MQSLKVRGPYGSLDFQTLLVLGPLQKPLLPFIFHGSVPLLIFSLLRNDFLLCKYVSLVSSDFFFISLLLSIKSCLLSFDRYVLTYDFAIQKLYLKKKKEGQE